MYHTSPLNSFGKILKYNRLNLGLTQTQLASITGVNYKSIGHYENGYCYPNKEFLNKLSLIMNINDLLIDNYLKFIYYDGLEKLIMYRKSKNLSYTQFAKILGVSKDTIIKWESLNNSNFYLQPNTYSKIENKLKELNIL